MDRNGARQLNILDILALIVASGVFFYVISCNSKIISASIADPSCPFLLRVGGVLDTAVAIAIHGSVFPMTLLILWFRQPRACFQDLIRKPGFSACLIWSLSIAFFLIAKLSSLLFKWREQMNPVDFADIARAPVKFCVEYLHWSFIPLAYSLAVVWLFQRLAGLWEPESSWIDRAGRFYGFYVIVFLFIGMFLWS